LNAVLAVATGLAMMALAWFSYPPAATPKRSGASTGSDGGWSATSYGPLGPDDRAMLVAVRQAALWQVPLGQQAQRMADADAVRAAADTLVTAHSELAGPIRATAGQLGVVLPSLPTPEQQAWMAELSGETGADYDWTLVNRLHSGATATAAQVDRVLSITQNTLVRAVAVRAADVLNGQIRNLESTGLVAPAPAQPSEGRAYSTVLGMVVLVAALCVFGFFRAARRQPRRHRLMILTLPGMRS
jgi:predicted outer membrane protein